MGKGDGSMSIAEACNQNNNFLNAMLNIEWTSQVAMEPFTIYKPKIFPDGDQWCVLLGANIQEGVVGFGDTPHKAVTNFNHNFDNQTLT